MKHLKLPEGWSIDLEGSVLTLSRWGWRSKPINVPAILTAAGIHILCKLLSEEAQRAPHKGVDDAG